VVAAAGLRTGLVNVCVLHTSASLVVQENADPAVRRDLQRFLARIVPEDADYEHDSEGADDMPSHIRAALTRTAETLPVSGGDLALAPGRRSISGSIGGRRTSAAWSSPSGPIAALDGRGASRCGRAKDSRAHGRTPAYAFRR